MTDDVGGAGLAQLAGGLKDPDIMGSVCNCLTNGSRHSGKRKGQWSVRINKQWRICFLWNADKILVTAVEITDYHWSMKTIAKSQARSKSPERLPSIHPGRILRKEVLEARGITQTQLATATGLPVSRINDLIKERRGITVDSAIRLSRALGTSVDLWLNLQRAYDLEEAQRTKAREYSRIELMAA